MTECCEHRRGNAGGNWHRRRNEPLCENAKIEQRRHNAQRVRWRTGTPIVVEEVEAL